MKNTLFSDTTLNVVNLFLALFCFINLATIAIFWRRVMFNFPHELVYLILTFSIFRMCLLLPIWKKNLVAVFLYLVSIGSVIFARFYVGSGVNTFDLIELVLILFFVVSYGYRRLNGDGWG